MDAFKPPQWERREQGWLDLDQARTLVEHLQAISAGTAILVKLSTEWVTSQAQRSVPSRMDP